MTKIDGGGIFFGIMIGVLLICVILIANSLSKRKLLVGKRKTVIGSVTIVVIIALSIYFAFFMGYSIKQGNYSNQECDFLSCGEPATCKLHLGVGGTDYYCSEHVSYAKETYIRYTKPSSNSEGKCCICGKKATETFQGSNYCTSDYNKAVKWAIDNVAEND